MSLNTTEEINDDDDEFDAEQERAFENAPEGEDEDGDEDETWCDGYGCPGCRECSDHDDTSSLNPHGPWGEA